MNDLTVFEEARSLRWPLEPLRSLLVEQLPAVLRAMPNVLRIEALEQRWQGGLWLRRDRWFGRSRSALLTSVLPGGAASWVVRSTWRLEPFDIHWELEPEESLGLTATGCVALEPEASGTRVTIAGTLSLGDERWRRWRALCRPLERQLSGHIRDNLGQLFDRAGALLEQSGVLVRQAAGHHG